MKCKQGMQVADIKRFCNKSMLMLCIILKRKEEISGLDVAIGVMRVSNQWPHILEEVEMLFLIWINKKKLGGDTVTNNFVFKKAKALYAKQACK